MFTLEALDCSKVSAVVLRVKRIIFLFDPVLGLISVTVVTLNLMGRAKRLSAFSGHLLQRCPAGVQVLLGWRENIINVTLFRNLHINTCLCYQVFRETFSYCSGQFIYETILYFSIIVYVILIKISATLSSSRNHTEDLKNSVYTHTHYTSVAYYLGFNSIRTW